MRMSLFLVGLTGLSLSAWVFANSAPYVTNVQASQRNDDSKQVDIYYDLYDADAGDVCTVWVAVSDDGGATWSVPAITFTGAVGKNISPGTGKYIRWDAGRDLPGRIATFKARVYADDGKGPIEMVTVPAGYFAYQNAAVGNYTFVNSFLIAKYEVTNEQYCQFLNAGDPTSLYWSSSMNGEIERLGTSGAYYYRVVADRDKYPVRYVSWYDAAAFCAWLSTATGQNYRLPTEQEWEKAAGWNPATQGLWTYGYQSHLVGCQWLSYNGIGCYNGPLPVGSFNGTGGKNDACSYYGCYDMSGNVWEWTSSWYNENSSRVDRGGSGYGSAITCAVVYREGNTQTYRSASSGFRFVLSF